MSPNSQETHPFVELANYTRQTVAQQRALMMLIGSMLRQMEAAGILADAAGLIDDAERTVQATSPEASLGTVRDTLAGRTA